MSAIGSISTVAAAYTPVVRSNSQPKVVTPPPAPNTDRDGDGDTDSGSLDVTG